MWQHVQTQKQVTSPSHGKHTNTTVTHIDTRWTFSHMFVDNEEGKLEHWEKPHRCTVRTCKLDREGPEGEWKMGFMSFLYSKSKIFHKKGDGMN